MEAKHSGAKEVRKAVTSCVPGFLASGIFSFLINVLMLTGPMYMMLVYDRALGSRSENTLVGLTVLVGGLFAAMGLLSLVRSRLLVRMGNRFSQKLEARVFSAQLQNANLKKGGALGQDASRDLGSLREFIGGPTLPAFFDVPWTPVYVAVAYILHPILGWMGAAGFVVLFAFGILNDVSTRRKLGEASGFQAQGSSVLGDAVRNSEVIAALKMGPGIYERWRQMQGEAQQRQSKASDSAATYATLSRTLRIMLQSAVLGTGAYLAITGDLSAGSIIAASVIVGRGLAPAEQAISGWRQYTSARASYKRLVALLDAHPPSEETIQLPQPKGGLQLSGVFASEPGGKEPILKNISFQIAPGEMMALIGPSGSGKSTLARVMVGAWPALRGDVRLDGANLAQWNDEQLGTALGYLPQSVELFDGTVRENIARFAEEINDEGVIAAATKAGVHEFILSLPNGYGTELGEGGSGLSGGERQRIGLARAVYGDPAFIVLDEPNSNLDNIGEHALQDAIAAMKQAGQTVVIVAHRPSILSQADQVLVMHNGTVASFGPRDEVLQKTVAGNVAARGKVVSMEMRA